MAFLSFLVDAMRLMMSSNVDICCFVWSLFVVALDLKMLLHVRLARYLTLLSLDLSVTSKYLLSLQPNSSLMFVYLASECLMSTIRTC